MSAVSASPRTGRMHWSPELAAGLILLAVPLLPIVVGPLLVTPQMAEVFGDVPNLQPSPAHPLGTQSEGRDLLAATEGSTSAAGYRTEPSTAPIVQSAKGLSLTSTIVK